MDNHTSEHRNGDIVRIRELHQLLDSLEARIGQRLTDTEARLSAQADQHRADHHRGSRTGLQVMAIVVAALAMLLSAFLGVLQIVT